MGAFLSSVSDWLQWFIFFIGGFFIELTDSEVGLLSGLLPLFAIAVSISLLFLGIKIIRKFIWGS